MRRESKVTYVVLTPAWNIRRRKDHLAHLEHITASDPARKAVLPIPFVCKNMERRLSTSAFHGDYLERLQQHGFSGKVGAIMNS